MLPKKAKMQYQSKSLTVEAFEFQGTEESGRDAQDWLSSLDVENAEVSWQGSGNSLALDVMSSGRITTIEAGDFLYVQFGALFAESEATFLKRYEPARSK